MHMLQVDAGRCNGCKACVDVCFVNVIGWDGPSCLPVLKYPEDCQLCTVCERACPSEAIRIVPDWDSRYCPRYLSVERGR